MTSPGGFYGHLIAATALTLVCVGTALAAPSIQAVYTDHSKGGTPVSINIVGSGFTCADCGPPKVSLGGLSLTVKAHSAKVITAVLPQPVAAGDYTLAVTTGPAARAEVARFSLSVAPFNPGRVVTTTATRPSVSADAIPPPPTLLRGASTSTTRTAGPLSRSGRSSGKTSAVTAAGAASTAGIVPEPAPYQVVSGLPEYNTAYGDFALYKVSTGRYDTTPRANSAFGYAALLNTTDGSYNNAFGFYSLYSNIDGGNNNAFGNWALLYNTSGTSNNAFGHQALYSNTTGYNNSAFGHEALYSTTTGQSNTATGAGALRNNTAGSYNTASGLRALHSNTTGFANTASGTWALQNNTTGSANTASGMNAMIANTTGDNNTASGESGLRYNTTGYENTASGKNALLNNTTGYQNTASGVDALQNNTTGHLNSASGAEALYSNRGAWNTASGAYALFKNSTGNNNTAVGIEALRLNTTGSGNTALGQAAGYDAIGSNNIYIGSEVRGSSTDNAVIRIGNSTFGYRTYVAGIRGVTTGSTGAVPVLIDENGQLGTVSSSRRYKEDIQPMGSMSERLFALRPVTFRYKQAYQDGSTPLQFGLIAEEVAEVFPELAVYGKDGQPETVSYHLLATLLLNELQKEHRVSASLQEQVSALTVQNEAVVKQNEALVQANEAQVARMTALEQQVAVLAKVVGRTEKDRMVASAR